MVVTQEGMEEAAVVDVERWPSSNAQPPTDSLALQPMNRAVGLFQGSNVDQSLDPFQDSSAVVFPSSNVARCQNRIVGLYPSSSVEVFPVRSVVTSPDRNVPVFPDKSAPMFLSNSAALSLSKIVAVFPANNVALFQDSNVVMFRDSSAKMFPASSA